MHINIEYTFGILVHRWGCLRKPPPSNISLPKIVALVRRFCLLHSFCINEEDPPNAFFLDEINIANEVGFSCNVYEEDDSGIGEPAKV